MRLTRRRMLTAIGGAAVGVVAGYLLSPAKGTSTEATAQEAPPLPWPYEELDPEETRKLGHLGYYFAHCAGGSFWAIAVQLKEKIGFPWTGLPVPSRDEVLAAVNEGKKKPEVLMMYGVAGAVGWGSLCGGLNGALCAMQLVAEEPDWKKTGQALLRWYEEASIPSDKINEYAVLGELYPKKLKSSKWLPSSVSGSVLCHESVGRWCVVSGYASGSKERAERCARLTGDVAAKAVEILNAYARGEAASFKLSPTTALCRLCHYTGRNYEQGQFTRGFMECEKCHKDLTPPEHPFYSPPEES